MIAGMSSWSIIGCPLHFATDPAACFTHSCRVLPSLSPGTAAGLLRVVEGMFLWSQSLLVLVTTSCVLCLSCC